MRILPYFSSDLFVLREFKGKMIYVSFERSELERNYFLSPHRFRFPPLIGISDTTDLFPKGRQSLPKNKYYFFMEDFRANILGSG